MAQVSVAPRRASDRDRDRAVATLRRAVVDGRLSQDSFVERVDSALRARDVLTLGELVADLRVGRGLAPALWAAVAGALDAVTGNTTVPVLVLPGPRNPVRVIGRRPDCDVVLPDSTVSRVHAVLMWFSGRWFLIDRGSTNGTSVNGRRIWGATVVEPADRVSFGGTTLALRAPRRTPSWSVKG